MDEKFKIEIKTEFDKWKERLGSKKLHLKLKERGITIGVNRISRLMKEMGLSCISEKPSRWTSPNYKRYRSNKVNRQFEQQVPNSVWLSDFTYIKIADSFYYLCAIIDLFSRKVVSYHLSNSIDTETLIYTFDQAYVSRKYPENLTFHSDQGTQYVSYRFTSYLKELGVNQSFWKPAVRTITHLWSLFLLH